VTVPVLHDIYAHHWLAAANALDRATTHDECDRIVSPLRCLPECGGRAMARAALLTARERIDRAAAPAPALVPAPAPALVPAPAPVVEAPASVAESTDAEVPPALVDALTAISAQSAHAAAVPTVAASDRASVGYRTPEGWLHGATGATNATYRAHCIAQAARMGLTIDPATLPPLDGVVVVDTVDALLATRTFGVGESLLITVDSTGSIQAGALRAACGAAPEGKRMSTHLRDAIDDVRRSHHARAEEQRQARPVGVTTRWAIAHDGGIPAEVGAPLSRCRVLVDLLATGRLVIEGDPALGGAVEARYAARSDGEIYQGAEVSAWVRGYLCSQFDGVAAYKGILVPPQHRDAARAWARALSTAWGVFDRGAEDPAAPGHYLIGLPIGTAASVVGGFVGGLDAEITAEDRRWDRAAGPRGAQNAVARVEALRARVASFGALLGAARVAPLTARVDALRAALVEALDDLRQRAALLELD
jgi:hypothetical protein